MPASFVRAQTRAPGGVAPSQAGGAQVVIHFAFNHHPRCPLHGFDPCVRQCTGHVKDCPQNWNSAAGQGPAAARKGDDAPAALAPGVPLDAGAGHCAPPQVDSDGPNLSSARHLSCVDFYTADIEAREDCA